MARRRKSRSTKEKAAVRLVDTGPDASGRYAPSPWLLQHGHQFETAPKELRQTPDSSFPKRIVTQRVLDWYLSRKHITKPEWQAGNTLWEIWCASGLEAKVTSGYEPVTTHGQASQDHKIAKRVDAVHAFTLLMGDTVPYHCRGVVRAVVIEDRTAAEWAQSRGKRSRDSKAYGLARLRAGLQALAEVLGY